MVVGGVVIVALIGVALLLVNVNSGPQRALESCSARDGIDVRVYYASPLSKTDIVFDFRGATGSSVRRIDPVHLLLQFGYKVNSDSMQRLILAHEGRKLFYIQSSDLKELSREYTVGNPVWSLNHVPERVMGMEGYHAYGQWEGGWLGVLEKQTKDLNKFITDWTGS